MKRLQFLGSFSSHIMGNQYYEHRVSMGEELGFERNPANEFDAAAVEIYNSSNRLVGHLPRECVAWIAPLLDAGRLHLTGRALAEKPEDKGIPIEVHTHVAHKGADLLRPEAPHTAKELIHAFLVREFSSQSHPAETYFDLYREFKSLPRHHMSPEVRLFYTLLPWKGEKLRSEAAKEALCKTLASVTLPDPLHHGNMTVLPVFHDCGPGVPDYLLLKEALKSDHLRIREKEYCQVSVVSALNTGPAPVLLLAGDEIIGAGQDRIINVSMLLPPSDKPYDLPVSCVERGRWDESGEAFKPGRRAHARVRNSLLESVRENNRKEKSLRADQDAVWEAVHSCACDLGVDSSTTAMGAVYTAKAEDLEQFPARFPYPEKACGAAVFINNTLLGLDIFQSPMVAQKVWNDLITAYGPESLHQRELPQEINPREFIAARLRAVPDHLGIPRPSLGRGYDVGIEIPEMPGAALVDTTPLHVATFGTHF